MALEPTQSVFDHVLLRPATDGSGLAYLTWRAGAQGDRVVQVYVDGRLYDVSGDRTQRAMWLQLDPTRDHALELLAVDPSERWREMSEKRSGRVPPWVHEVVSEKARDESLPIDARVTVKVDHRLVADEAVWSSEDHRGGFGGLHGEGLFGFDLATAPGNGQGDFGYGPFGSGGEAWCWVGLLGPGEHQVEINFAGSIETIEAAIDNLGEPIAPGISGGPPVTLNW